MGFSSQAGWLIAKTQAAPATLDPDLVDEGIAIPLRSGSLGSSRELLVTDPEIGGGRDVRNAYLGAVAYSGDLELYPRVDSLATLLKAAFGSAAAVTTTGVTTHTITPSDSAQLPFLSVQERIGSGLETYNYTDAVVNTIHLEADANGYLMGTAGLIARIQAAGVTPATDPNWDDGPLYVGTNITVTYNSVTLPAKSFSLDFNNQFEDDDFRLGSFFLGDLTPKRREVTASFSIRENSSALWRQAVYGVPSATSPGGLVTKAPLVINIAAYEAIPGGTPTTPYSMQFTFPSFVLNPYQFGPSGDDIIESDVEGRALRPLAATPICTAVLKTGLAAIV